MKRVVITGMGTITSLGHNVRDFWQNIVAGKSGAAPITKFNTAHFKTKFACEVKDFQPNTYLDRNEIKRSDLFTQYALYASTEAINDSGIDLKSISPFDIGVIWGSGNGGMGTFEEEVKAYSSNEYRPHFSPFFVPKLLSNMASGLISMKFGLMGINHTTVTACASANSALMEAFNYIRLGKAKLFVSGGSEAPVTEAAIGGFNAMRAMSVNNERPEEACRPFDQARDGFVMGEGSGAMILEEYEHAKARGAKIYAEIVGAAMTADAYHISSSHPEGLGAAHAMNLALEEGGINAADVDYLNTHATSTPVGDLSEINAARKVFGDNPEKLKISATKSMTGHLLGAAGAIEGIICVKALQDGIVPPTINTSALDPAIPKTFDVVTKESQQVKLNYAMSNTFGFGGHNAIVLFKRFD
ncbi:MAG: beta-ketoacyl-ACP synthase II [Cyclobacteriaceae bacterium]